MNQDTSGAGEGLMPCPFCGGKAKLETEPVGDSFTSSVECVDCGVWMAAAGRDVPKQVEELTRDWNHRADTRSAPPATASYQDEVFAFAENAEKPKDQEAAVDEVERVAKALLKIAEDRWFEVEGGGIKVWQDMARAALSQPKAGEKP